MAHRKHLDDFLRSRIIGRLECGRTQLEVSEELGIAQSVIPRVDPRIESVRDGVNKMVIRSKGAVEYVMVGVPRRPTQAIWRGKEIEPVQVIVMSFDPVKIVVASELKQFEFNGIEVTEFIWRAPIKNTHGETNIGIDFGSVSIHFPLRWALESINGKGKKIGKDLMKRNKRVQLRSWDKTWKEIVTVVPKLEFKVERANNNMNGGNA
ncbi:hypothetical protein TNCV_4251791 [Trichonephila clavipes]|nr:hypothetical protein TNCV_4251791 [Trichonephila clavipes]